MELEETKKQIVAMLKNVKPSNATAEQVVESARELLGATAEVVFASNQADVIQAGKSTYSALEKLITRSAGASRLARTDPDGQAINQSAAKVAQTVCQLLETGKLNRQDEGTTPKLEQSSGLVAGSINTLVDALKKLPGAEKVQLEDSKNDLDKVAEEELRKCADIISKAAATLLAYKPPPRERKVGVLDKMDINEAIVKAAQAIAAATGSLVNNAYDAQKERVDNKAKNPRGRYANDPTWANGLISASHNVAGSVQALVQSANQAADGKVEEESLVASARSVASATAHLVSASKAKSDPNSKAQQSLTAAAKSVATATSQLVAAAGQAAQFTEEQEEEDINKYNFGTAGGKAKELEQQTLILKLEKELEKERKRMLGMRKQKYQQNQ
jgi:talin